MSAQTLAALQRGELAGARTLSLAGCGLDTLPDDLLGLADTLEALDLAGNALRELPHWLPRLRRLRVLFGSGNPFDVLPPVLGDCPALSQVGFRGCGLHTVPGESLPAPLRWLTLTDNRLRQLPSSLGERPQLTKLMLAGNQLTDLPLTLAGAPRLELLRVAANRLPALPGWVVELPALAWLAAAGNDFDEDLAEHQAQVVTAAELTVGARLGEGASGEVFAATWQGRDVAVKRFKGAMTSDGLPERERAASLRAGEHPNVLGALACVAPGPGDAGPALLLPRLPAPWRPLAGPPSLASCSRDVYDPALQLPPPVMQRLALGSAHALAHLHAQRVLHGDCYAHNLLWDGAQGDCRLSDFGAALCVPAGLAAEPLMRLDVRAWGLLLDELLARTAPALPMSMAWQALVQQCVSSPPAHRPLMPEVLAQLTRLVDATAQD